MVLQNWNQTMLEIGTPRLIIRTAVQSDAKAFREFLMKPENFPYGEPEMDLTMDRISRRIDTFADLTAKGERGWVVFVLRETSELIGYGGYNTFESVYPAEFFLPRMEVDMTTSLSPVEKKNMTDLGISIDHKYWRKGYGLEIIEALIEYSRNNFGCQLFRAETADNNQPWRSLMRAAGLSQFESRQRASYDNDQEVWAWKWDTGHWEQSKTKLEADGKWLL